MISSINISSDSDYYLDNSLNKYLTHLIIQFQQIYKSRLDACSDDNRQLLDDQINHIFEEINFYLKSGLRRAIRYMPLDYTYDDLVSYIFEKLPVIKIDPQLNAMGLLITIARYKVIEQLKKNRVFLERYSSLESELNDGYGFNKDIISHNLDDPVSEYIDNKELYEEVSNWLLQVRIEDQKIFWRRFYGDSFRDIASALGPGWTEDAVRQRYSRLIRVMRKSFEAEREGS